LLGPLADRIALPDLARFVELPKSEQTPATRGSATVTTAPATVPAPVPTTVPKAKAKAKG